MKQLFLLSFVFISLATIAQKTGIKKSTQHVDLSFAFGNNENSVAASYFKNYKVGKTKKFEIGWGARVTSYFATKKEFITAPAKLARTTTIPFLIVFAGEKPENIDTLTIQRPQTNAVNAFVNLGYHFTPKLSVAFNIDVIGFTFGSNTSSILQSNGVTTTESSTKPVGFNLLLTGDNDLGGLNSDFSVKYQLNNKFAIRAVYQYLFVEYKTTTQKQIAPGGISNDRFRNKSNMLGLGFSYSL